jgi:hypothetical protein
MVKRLKKDTIPEPESSPLAALSLLPGQEFPRCLAIWLFMVNLLRA